MLKKTAVLTALMLLLSSAALRALGQDANP